MSTQVFLSVNSNHPVARQTPASAGRWGDTYFRSDLQDASCDYWVVFESAGKHRKTLECRSGHAVFVTGEPMALRSYPPGYLRQFSTVVTCRTDIRHPHVIRCQPMIPWWVGISGGHGQQNVSLDYDALRAADPVKSRKLSVVCSNKVLLAGHRRRLEFVKALKAQLKEDIDVFGSGFEPIPDKWDALAQYRYHIAIENSSEPDYWTEKLADPLLAKTFPLYWGCTNLASYFSPMSFRLLDLDDFSKSIRLVAEVMESDLHVSARDAAAI